MSYTINYKVTYYNMGTLRGGVATFQHRDDAYRYANTLMQTGMIDVKVYGL